MDNTKLAKGGAWKCNVVGRWGLGEGRRRTCLQNGFAEHAQLNVTDQGKQFSQEVLINSTNSSKHLPPGRTLPDPEAQKWTDDELSICEVIFMVYILGWCKSNCSFALLNFAIWYWDAFLNVVMLYIMLMSISHFMFFANDLLLLIFLF